MARMPACLHACMWALSYLRASYWLMDATSPIPHTEMLCKHTTERHHDT